MAKLDLKDALEKSLLATKEYIDAELVEKANTEHGTHLTLGTGSRNAFRGDYGNTAYQHSQAAHAPSNAQKNSDITKTEIENKLTGTISSHMHDYITSMDTRSANSAPNTYTTRGIYPEFKSTSTVGLPNVGKNFAGVITYQQWGDTTSWSGGKATQFATIDDGRMYFRKGDGSGWGAWNRFYTNLHKPDLEELGAAPANHNHSFVPTAGGTMTGNLIMNNNVPIRLKNSGGTAWSMFVLNGSNNFHIGGGYQDNNQSTGNTYITAGGNMEYRVMSSGGCHGFYDNLSSGSARQIAEFSSANGLRILKGSLYTLGGISIGTSGSAVHFNQGAGYIRVGSANPLYLQTDASDSSSTATEIRCSKLNANSTYIPLRAYNLNATNAVYAKGTNLSSDRTLKENIKYISNANTINDEDITIMDCYNFIKDDLGLATYNYIDDPEKQQKIGFIAQDVLYDPIKQTDNKIGQLVITKLLGSEQLDPENPKLTYDVNNVLGVMLGAMQVTANKTAALEQENKELKELVNRLFTRIEKLEQK